MDTMNDFSVDLPFTVEETQPVFNFPGDVILTWTQQTGQILANNTKYIVRQKFNVGFEYDDLIVESASNSAFKTIHGNRIILSPEEFKQCLDFVEAWGTSPMLPVFVYDKDKHNYLGKYTRGEAETQGWTYTYNIPPAGQEDISVYNEDIDAWEKAVAVIREDGTLILEPGGICPKCKLIFTDAQWNNFPHPNNPHNDRYNFETQEWYDARDLGQTREQTIMSIRFMFVRARVEYVETAPQEEAADWKTQEAEAKAYSEDATASTPFLDGMISKLNEMGDPTTKEEMAARIMRHVNDAILRAKGEVHGEMYYYINRAREAQDLKALDAIQEEVKTLFNIATQA